MKLVTHYLPSLRSNPSPCELMRVLERLPAAGKAQMLSPSVLCCWGTSAELAPAAGGKQPRLVSRQTLCAAPRKGEHLSAPACPSAWAAVCTAALEVHVHLRSGDSQHHFSWRDSVSWTPMSGYQSTFLLGWGWLFQTGSFQQVT